MVQMDLKTKLQASSGIITEIEEQISIINLKIRELEEKVILVILIL